MLHDLARDTTRVRSDAMFHHVDHPLHAILMCEEMEDRETPAVLVPASSALPLSNPTATAPAQAAPVTTLPSVNNPFGSFALPPSSFVTATTSILIINPALSVSLPDPQGGISVLAGRDGGNLMVSAEANNATVGAIPAVNPLANNLIGSQTNSSSGIGSADGSTAPANTANAPTNGNSSATASGAATTAGQ